MNREIRQQTVQIATYHHDDLWEFLLPSNADGWAGYKFVVCNKPMEADWLVVYDRPLGELKTPVPWHRRILAITEPRQLDTESVWNPYPPQLRAQFGVLAGPHDYPMSNRSQKSVQAAATLPWHIRTIYDDSTPVQRVAANYDNLKKSSPHPKNKSISIIYSGKNISPRHRQRYEFAAFLREQMGDDLHAYGREVLPIDDKAEGLLDYRYTIAIENNETPDFWTEKLADSYLARCLPIYSGCPNAEDYFGKDALVRIDINDHEKALHTIRTLLQDDPYDKLRDKIEAARSLIFNRYSFFQNIAHVITAVEQNLPHSNDAYIENGEYTHSKSLPTRQDKMDLLKRPEKIRQEFGINSFIIVRLFNKVTQRAFRLYLGMARSLYRKFFKS